MATKTTTVVTCDLCGGTIDVATDDMRSHSVEAPDGKRYVIMVGPALSNTDVKDACRSCRITVSKNDPVLMS